MRRYVLRAALCCLTVFFPTPLAAATIVVAGDTQQPIPASGTGPEWMQSVALDVAASFIISDLNVGLDITHGDVTDLGIILDCPDGAAVQLAGDWDTLWRNPQQDMLGTIFDDDADIPISAGRAPFQDRFRPTPGQELALFNGRDAKGIWTLRIYDRHYGNSGTLNRWELHFTIPEPASLIYLLTALFILHRRRRNMR